ncbi:heavy-metal-associated domain-containing protein [Nonomuraea sp. NPDC003727]|uniref:heavy-metal-associated domain-containing protein n=1 Tax=Nonomuraea sp. NPDC003804 TaxID=3154547 RepID=UPI0033BD3E70
MSTSTFVVSGMTCGHCVGTVKSEVGKVSGVSAVDVELASGKVTVTADGPVDEARVREAVEEAGYELVGS